MSMSFDTRQAGVSRSFEAGRASDSGRSYESGRANAGGKEFRIEQKSLTKDFPSKDFAGAKSSWFSRLNFFTKKADPKGKFEIPNASNAPGTKTVPTNVARNADKTMETRGLPDVRPYLGKEADKISKPLDPTNLPRTSGEMHEIKTIDDVRELLNKNK